MTFGIEDIKKAGYKPTTPVIITNTDQCSDVQPAAPGKIGLGEHVLEINPVKQIIKVA